jgi:hypothetical protein
MCTFRAHDARAWTPPPPLAAPEVWLEAAPAETAPAS